MEQRKYEGKRGQAPEAQQKNYVVTKAQLLIDLKLLTDGIFEGETRDTADGLLLAFPNGQTFRIAVEELV